VSRNHGILHSFYKKHKNARKLRRNFRNPSTCNKTLQQLQPKVLKNPSGAVISRYTRTWNRYQKWVVANTFAVISQLLFFFTVNVAPYFPGSDKVNKRSGCWNSIFLVLLSWLELEQTDLSASVEMPRATLMIQFIDTVTKLFQRGFSQ